MKNGSYYFFTGKPTAWSINEDSPTFTIPVPSMDSYSLQENLREIIALKQIQGVDVSLGIRRYDWKYGDIYDSYDYRDENILRKQYYENTKPFYVMTDTFDVYKCLNNANGSISTIKPQQFLYVPFTLADGYTWKYLFTIPEELRIKFLSDFYIPVQLNDELITNSTQQLIAASAIKGSIDNVTIINPGSGYALENTVIEVYDPENSDFVNKSSGFTATAEVSEIDGSITKVVVNNPGFNYSNRTMLSVQGIGTDAEIIPQISPENGHGSNIVYELGAFYTLVSVKIDNADIEFFPDDIPYRKVGIITDHVEYGTSNQQYTQEYYFGPTHTQFSNMTLRNSNPEQFMAEGIGTILYLNYISKISRAINQKETLKFVLETI